MDIISTHIHVNDIRTYTYRGNWYCNQAYNVDFPVGTTSGQAKVLFISCGFTHYNTGYQCNNISWHYVYGGALTNGNTIQNTTTGNSGGFSYTTPSSGTFRVTKSAGSYGGIGFSNILIWTMN